MNGKDPIANMKITEAVEMENWFPEQSSVDLRKGMTAHVTGFASAVQTLASYNNGTTQNYLRRRVQPFMTLQVPVRLALL